MDSPKKINPERLAVENQELKELVLKLNSDKTMFEKKVERRNQDIQKLRSQLQLKEDEVNRLSKATQETQSDTLTMIDGYKQLRQKVELMANKFVGNERQGEEDSCAFVLRMIEETNQSVKSGKSEIARLTDQMKLDTNYANKRINQLEEKFAVSKKELQWENKILETKLSYLIQKINGYESSAKEISYSVKENRLLQMQLEYLIQYVNHIETEVMLVDQLVSQKK